MRYSELFVEIHQLLPTPPAFGALVSGDPLEFQKYFWRVKTRVTWLSFGIICIMLHLPVLVEHGFVTDRQRAIAYTALRIARVVETSRKANEKKTALDRGRTERISLTLELALDHDLDFQSPATCGHDLYLQAKVQGQRSDSSEDRL